VSIFLKILKILFPVVDPYIVDKLSNASFTRHVEYLNFMGFGMQVLI